MELRENDNERHDGTLPNLPLTGLLVAGISVGVWVLASGRGPSRATEILKERLARGEISSDEYVQNLKLVGNGRSSTPPLIVAAILMVVGLVGLLALATSSFGRGFMHDRMGSMMGRGGMMEMMRGDSGRIGDPETEGAREIRIQAYDFSFQPSTVSMRSGEKVNVVLDNRGGMFHTLSIPGLVFELRANSGERIGGSLTPDKQGPFEILCTVPGHVEAGMRATLTVKK